ncbi:MAG TPA: response regulator [Candidatus Paceibacterota bacterium]|nr:response regulator [Candidatus Paceibacterota bacterium]
MAKMVLIIEDDNFLLGLEAKKLKKEGYDISTAVNSEEAFRLIDSRVKIDLILLALMLPDVDGFTILEKVRKNGSKEIADVPVIIFSNLSEEKDIERAKSLGISEFMVKSNFTLDELAAKVKELIGA